MVQLLIRILRCWRHRAAASKRATTLSTTWRNTNEHRSLVSPSGGGAPSSFVLGHGGGSHLAAHRLEPSVRCAPSTSRVSDWPCTPGYVVAQLLCRIATVEEHPVNSFARHRATRRNARSSQKTRAGWRNGAATYGVWCETGVHPSVSDTLEPAPHRCD